MTPAGVRRALARPEAWPEVHVVDELDSTNRALKAWADGGARPGTVLIARCQTAGRGRSGRAWSSDPGGLWLSALIESTLPPERAGCLSLLTAVALADGLNAAYDLKIGVKWPNDLYWNGRKLAGILIELSGGDSNRVRAVIGVGLNVNNPVPQNATPPAVSLAGIRGRELDLAPVASVVLGALADGLDAYAARGFEPVRRRWEALSVLGERIVFERAGARVEAQPLGLEPDGRLRVETAHGPVLLAAEDVHTTIAQGSVT